MRNADVFEQIAEDKLNRVLSPQSGYNYEMLNFSVGGYSLVQYLMLSEQKLLEFEPDYVFITTHAGEGSRVVANILKIYNKGTSLSPELQQFLDTAGVTSEMEYSETKTLLDELEQDIVRWGYQRLLAQYNKHGIVPIWLFVPPNDGASDRLGRTHGEHVGV